MYSGWNESDYQASKLVFLNLGNLKITEDGSWNIGGDGSVHDKDTRIRVAS